MREPAIVTQPNRPCSDADAVESRATSVTEPANTIHNQSELSQASKSREKSNQGRRVDYVGQEEMVAENSQPITRHPFLLPYIVLGGLTRKYTRSAMQRVDLFYYRPRRESCRRFPLFYSGFNWQ